MVPAISIGFSQQSTILFPEVVAANMSVANSSNESFDSSVFDEETANEEVQVGDESSNFFSIICKTKQSKKDVIYQVKLIDE